jgi:CheY-like chemotaxis protein
MADMIRGVLNEPISLVLDLAPVLGTVEADPHQLEQIILNLATNARDAMPDGGQLIVKTWNEPLANVIPQTDSLAGYVGLSITDTGQGMDQATQSRVFEPFFSTKPLYKGTGLGLATVYGTVKQSRGHISVQSEVGRGTTFTILLPYTTDAVRRDLEPRALQGTEGSETILLVEDDAAVREVLVRGLEQEGYHVLSAANGREALELFSIHRPDIALIVTDLIMPEMGGIALGEHLRDVGATLPLVYISGYHQDMERQSSVELPLGRGFLLKPFNPQNLAIAIRRALSVRAKATAGRAQG